MMCACRQADGCFLCIGGHAGYIRSDRGHLPLDQPRRPSTIRHLELRTHIHMCLLTRSMTCIAAAASSLTAVRSTRRRSAAATRLHLSSIAPLYRMNTLPTLRPVVGLTSDDATEQTISASCDCLCSPRQGRPQLFFSFPG
ncbi:unnamed protein product [Periconia digitata]|uniref:Uncharacterized protein n=1 Tax=Periconia digitata TaxID=1303443 RepID=A0A9W4UIJ9_9PLEO|nr:unnamed protein product [Periconia digitata]